MKVAVFTGNNEILVLPFKYQDNNVNNYIERDIDYFDDWMTNSGRNVADYNVCIFILDQHNGIVTANEITHSLSNKK